VGRHGMVAASTLDFGARKEVEVLKRMETQVLHHHQVLGIA